MDELTDGWTDNVKTVYPHKLSLQQARSTRTGTCTRIYSSTIFSVLSCTQYFAKIMSTSTRTYSSTEAKSPVLVRTFWVLLSTFFILKRFYSREIYIKVSKYLESF